ncbi:hypothetical protein MCRY_20750 [Marivita cryptomonadis]|jgi:hypothetical protein|uniref:hypothetical protein n=1 Tax=Marivita cryptomonadis TaxID=505252 RepID=UPI000A1DE716|nr:hypothetical protein [Marivita cryptomonadis]OSQ55003.1 hypothetical protein MCRY_20750 [Marivita cryptomonadis]
MRNTFSISLDHGQTPEGLRATVASTPHPLGPFQGFDLMRGRRLAEFARFLFFEKSISLRFKRGPMTGFQWLRSQIGEMPPTGFAN